MRRSDHVRILPPVRKHNYNLGAPRKMYPQDPPSNSHNQVIEVIAKLTICFIIPFSVHVSFDTRFVYLVTDNNALFSQVAAEEVPQVHGK